MKKLYAHVEIVTAISAAQPAVRMFYVYRYQCDDGTFDGRNLPVLMLQTVSLLRYSKQHSENNWPTAPATHQGMIDENWNFTGHEVATQAIILDPEYGLITSDDDLIECDNSNGGLVQCPWPLDEARDKKACEDVYPELEDAIKQKIEIFEQRKQKATATANNVLREIAKK
jgi:hypothetical protein